MFSFSREFTESSNSCGEFDIDEFLPISGFLCTADRDQTLKKQKNLLSRYRNRMVDRDHILTLFMRMKE